LIVQEEARASSGVIVQEEARAPSGVIIQEGAKVVENPSNSLYRC